MQKFKVQNCGPFGIKIQIGNSDVVAIKRDNIKELTQSLSQTILYGRSVFSIHCCQNIDCKIDFEITAERVDSNKVHHPTKYTANGIEFNRSTFIMQLINSK